MTKEELEILIKEYEKQIPRVLESFINDIKKAEVSEILDIDIQYTKASELVTKLTNLKVKIDKYKIALQSLYLYKYQIDSYKRILNEFSNKPTTNG